MNTSEMLLETLSNFITKEVYLNSFHWSKEKSMELEHIMDESPPTHVL